MTTLLPNISEYNQRRLDKSLRCLTGCMAKTNKHQFENPEIYPYNLTLDVNILSYKIEKNDGFVISDGKMKITNETMVKLLYNVHGATFLFLRWLPENITSVVPIQSMFMIHLGEICAFMHPTADGLIAWSQKHRIALLQLLSKSLRCIDRSDILSENSRLFAIVNRRWLRIKLLLLGEKDVHSTLSIFPTEMIRHIISFLPRWNEINWNESVNGPRKMPILRKRKEICYDDTKRHQKKTKREIKKN